MRITSISIQNFRKLLRCRIDFSDEKTLFVGANNSGKTSAMDALGKFLAGRHFVLNDITLSNRVALNQIGAEWAKEECDIPNDLTAWDQILPKVDIWLEISRNEIHHVSKIIPTLKWHGGRLGVRLAFLPNDISKLFAEYREAYLAARTVESAKPAGSANIKLYPSDLCDYLEKTLATHFSINSFILDPAFSDVEPPQSTPFEMECFTDNPLQGIVKVDMIDAQRGFSDPDSLNGSKKSQNQLSSQLRSYYERHLDPEKIPSLEDLEILETMEAAREIFDKNLATKFAPAIKELEELGYPGVANPRITIASKLTTSETLKHDSAVQYALCKSDETLKLPEKYNGLGYQNLVSMIFDLMRFRDDWMREGKANQAYGKDNSAIEPLHLVLIEEPEAHLHTQVQQVFIRKAYAVLMNHDFLKENPSYSTQLIISTHSSHIAREADFADLRYFKRLPEGEECEISTSKVINLSDVFGKDDETGKFVTRYLQTTHCDLFFADAAILVEGSAESMLLPHFILNNFPELYQRYISILSIGGRHSHRLSPLIEKLCLPTLIITDLDPVEEEGHHRSVRPERGKNIISGNYAVTGWLIRKKVLDELLDIPPDDKEFTYKKPYEYSVRIAYQTPVKVEFAGVTDEVLSGTFEDCLIYTNLKTFGEVAEKDAEGLVKKLRGIINSSESLTLLHESVYTALRTGKSSQKAEFALDVIYSIDPSKITVPAYIVEGLDWLQTLLCGKEQTNGGR